MLRAPLAVLLALALAPAPVAAAEPWTAVTPAVPWATVNVCDTARHPDTIGIRASMPGPRRSRLAMRFRVQYREDGGAWVDVDAADSGWRDLGPGRGAAVESGWSFTFAH